MQTILKSFIGSDLLTKNPSTAERDITLGPPLVAAGGAKEAQVGARRKYIVVRSCNFPLVCCEQDDQRTVACDAKEAIGTAQKITQQINNNKLFAHCC